MKVTVIGAHPRPWGSLWMAGGQPPAAGPIQSKQAPWRQVPSQLCAESGGYSLVMSSLVVFSSNIQRLAVFYEIVLDAKPLNEPSGDIRLVNDRDEVLIHSIPKETAKDIEINSPPTPRENSPLKPVFDVVSLEHALGGVEAMGGVVTSRGFTLDGLTRRDVLDPDGNIIQLRCGIS